MATTTAKMSFVAVLVADPESPYLEEIIKVKEKVEELILRVSLIPLGSFKLPLSMTMTQVWK